MRTATVYPPPFPGCAARLRAVNVNVRYFAGAREAAGREAESFDVEDGSDIAALLTEIVRRHPSMEALRPSLRYALGNDFAAPEAVLATGAVVALLPPVGGG